MADEIKPAETPATAPVTATPEAAPAAPAARAGYRTTEFWLSSIAAVVGLVMASGIQDSSPVMKVAGLATLVLSALGYSVSRGLAKKA